MKITDFEFFSYQPFRPPRLVRLDAKESLLEWDKLGLLLHLLKTENIKDLIFPVLLTSFQCFMCLSVVVFYKASILIFVQWF